MGFNPHIIVKPYENKIDREDINKLGELDKNILKTAFTFSGQGIILSKEDTIGVLVRSYLEDDIHKIDLISKGIVDGSLELFKNNTISIGKELAISLDLRAGDVITLMSTANLQTPFVYQPP